MPILWRGSWNVPLWLKLLLQARLSWRAAGGSSASAKTDWIQQQEPGNFFWTLSYHSRTGECVYLLLWTPTAREWGGGVGGWGRWGTSSRCVVEGRKNFSIGLAMAGGRAGDDGAGNIRSSRAIKIGNRGYTVSTWLKAQMCFVLVFLRFLSELEANAAVGHPRRAGKHRLLRQRGRGDGNVRAERHAPHAARRGNRRRGDWFRGRVGLVSWGAGRFLWDLPIAAPTAGALHPPLTSPYILDTRMDCLVRVMDSSFPSTPVLWQCL